MYETFCFRSCGSDQGFSGRPLGTFGVSLLRERPGLSGRPLEPSGFRSCWSDQGFPVALDLRGICNRISLLWERPGLSGRPLGTFGGYAIGFRSCGSDQGFPVALDLRGDMFQENTPGRHLIRRYAPASPPGEAFVLEGWPWTLLEQQLSGGGSSA